MSIDPVRKDLVKEARLKGKSAADSLRHAGYSENTATHEVGRQLTLKYVDQEIKEELKAKDINTDWLLKEYLRLKKLTEGTKDYNTAKATIDSIAKFIAQIPDKLDLTQVDKADQEILDRYMRKPLSKN